MPRTALTDLPLPRGRELRGFGCNCCGHASVTTDDAPMCERCGEKMVLTARAAPVGGHVCDCCARAYRVEWAVTKELWDRVRQARDFLCMECFDAMARDAGVTLTVADLRFLSIGGSILVDAMPGGDEPPVGAAINRGHLARLVGLLEVATDPAQRDRIPPSWWASFGRECAEVLPALLAERAGRRTVPRDPDPTCCACGVRLGGHLPECPLRGDF